MVARIKSEMSVGLTPEIESALKVATEKRPRSFLGLFFCARELMD
jgi:hypothetical protein